MRILHVINRFWPARSGSEIHFGELSARLAAAGHRVLVATTTALDYKALYDPHGSQLSSARDCVRDVEIYRFPIRFLPGAPQSQALVQRLLALLSKHTALSTGILSRLTRYSPFVPGIHDWAQQTHEQFDLVAGMNILFHSVLQAGCTVAARQKIPFVLYPITHLGAGSKPGEGHPGPYYTMRHQLELISSSAAVIAQTITEKSYFQSQGVDPNRITVVGPGVEPSEINGGDKERFRRKHALEGPVVSFLSSLTYDKGVMHVVEAVNKLWDSGSKIELVLAGTVYDAFQAWWDKLPPKVRMRTRFLGHINEEEKRDLLAASDIVAVPSRTDSFGTVYLEAWLCRKPVIGARAWGIGDVIDDGKDGILVEFGDVQALADSMAKLVNDPQLRHTMGAAGCGKTLARHTWEHKYAQIQSIYNRLTARQMS
jgi:glycogen synthase